jgi:hypothetical protein
MFIASRLYISLRAPEERHVTWRVSLHAAPNGAARFGDVEL